MSVGVVDKTTGDRIPTAGDPLDKVGNLANLTTTAKDNAVNAINELNAGKQVKPTSISYSDWQLLTPQQQESGSWLVEGVPGGDLSARVSALENSIANENIVSQLTVSAYVDSINAYKNNKTVSVMLLLKTGEYSGNEVLVTIPQGLRPIGGMYQPLFNPDTSMVLSGVSIYVGPGSGEIVLRGTLNGRGLVWFTYLTT